MRADPQPVVAVGTASLDIHGFSEHSLIAGDSNPGTVAVSLGGVARNISENLARLGNAVTLVTALGGDDHGRRIERECSTVGIDMRMSVSIPGADSSTYMAMIDADGEMALALSDSRILEELTVELLQERRAVLEAAGAIVADAGLRYDCLDYLRSRFTGKPLILEAVSVKKCSRIPHPYHGFSCLKMNRAEAAQLTGAPIGDLRDLDRAGELLVSSGAQSVFITAGNEGVYYRDSRDSGVVPAQPTVVRNVSGAGDAFTAGAVHAQLRGLPIREAAEYGVAAAAIALQSPDTVSPNMSVAAVERLRSDAH